MRQKRSIQKELMDLGNEYYSDDEYKDCLEKLFRVHSLLGIYKDTLRLLKKCPAPQTVMDIGCGGGEFLLALAKENPSNQYIGTDISYDAIHYANKKLDEAKARNVSFVLQNDPVDEKSFDVIMANLVCHHLDDDALVAFFQNLYSACKKMVIINDLERSFLSYWLFKLLSPIVFNNRLISHDGLISIQKGFTRQELLLLIQKAKIPEGHFCIHWRFPFRWQLVLYRAENL